MSYYREIPKDVKPVVEQALLHMALQGLLPRPANQECLEMAEETVAQFDRWLRERRR